MKKLYIDILEKTNFGKLKIGKCFKITGKYNQIIYIKISDCEFLPINQNNVNDNYKYVIENNQYSFSIIKVTLK